MAAQAWNNEQTLNGAHDAGSPLATIEDSGLFDAAFYVQGAPELGDLGPRALAHYHLEGWQDGRKPNFYFDPAWYLATNPDVRVRGIDPLLHYIMDGEREGRRPCAVFDPVWYGAAHDVPAGELKLAHFLRNRHSGAARAIAEFDPDFYLRTYPDIEAAGVDPFEHYLVQGFREARRPSEEFDPGFYRHRYLRDRPDENPLLHYAAHKDKDGIHPRLPPSETTIAREVRKFCAPGPDFETRRPLPAGTARRARLFAYYLPQYHPIPENDAFWGDGFTEWTNLARGVPRFAGHYQPRIPRDLGHYRLDAASASDTLRRQIELARGAGIEGFVFYFYWFNGKRLLDAPLEAFLADRSLDFRFCLMWANENWTRRWDGSDEDVLIAQDSQAIDDAPLMDTLARHFADPRYVRLGDRPLFMVYRPQLLPAIASRVTRWRKELTARGAGDPILTMAQSFRAHDPRDAGFDGAVEFPPHKICDELTPLNPRLDMLDTDFSGRVYDYGEAARASLAEPVPPFPLIKTIVPSWDNDARRQGAGVVLHGASPCVYEDWLRALVQRAGRQRFFGEAIVCINAWNEWTEGAALEPDLHFGAAFLNATARAVANAPRGRLGGRLLLVGHDALAHGAQMLLLALARRLVRVHGAVLSILLLGPGPLEPQFASVAPTRRIARGDKAMAEAIASFRAEGVDAAIVNSLACGEAASALERAGIRTVLLAHEMQGLLREKNLIGAACAGMEAASEIVVACPEVAESLASLSPLQARRAQVLPQGLYRRPADPDARAAARRRLGATPREIVVLGLGYADLRKGFDLFLALARQSRLETGRKMRFVWAGGLDPTLADHLGPEIEAEAAAGGFVHAGFVEDPSALLAAADCLALTSREDPFPSVVLEALGSGLPVVAFAGSGGAPGLIRATQGGSVVPRGDLHAFAAAIRKLAARRGAHHAARGGTAREIRRRYNLGDYACRLMSLARPASLDVSVVVPSCNYAGFMEERLASIFGQQGAHVREIIVLDDASTDDSVARARAMADRAGRAVDIVTNARNSGSPFAQWHRAVLRARGTWLWIAEADDVADPFFLASLADMLEGEDDVVLGFTDSVPIDADGTALGPDYKSYYRQGGGIALERDGIHAGPEFVSSCLADRNTILNASAVLFRRAALRTALRRCGPELATMKVAGDWRIYVEMLKVRGARVAYVAAPRNRHRRHDASATARVSAAVHGAEQALVRAAARTEAAE